MFRLRSPFPQNEPGDMFWNRAGPFNQWNRNKYSLTLDLTHPLGKEVFKALARISDVVAENFAAGVMDRLGLGYEVLRKLRPDIILLSNTGYGRTGPWAGFIGMAQVVEAMTTAHLTGYPDRRPAKAGQSPMDIVAAWNMASAVILALLHRDLTGRGQHIDHSILEPSLHLIAAELLDYQMNGREAFRSGNHHPFKAPYGCYPCQGEDEWVVIEVNSEEEWEGLVRAMGSPPWSQEPRFSTPLGRLQHRDELDERISQWTRGFDKMGLMHLLQGEGVPCGAVLTLRELALNPHLWRRGFFERISHPPETGVGTRVYPGRPFRLSRTPGRVQRPAPPLGQDNEFVLHELLGLSRREVEELYRERVIGREAWQVRKGEGPRTYSRLTPPSVPSIETLLQRGTIREFDPDYEQALSQAGGGDEAG
jgi:crotonobetainyl-CoA:carnitine CoA-transferase CaiB-like acyl-CoA transferase